MESKLFAFSLPNDLSLKTSHSMTAPDTFHISGLKAVSGQCWVGESCSYL